VVRSAGRGRFWACALVGAGLLAACSPSAPSSLSDLRLRDRALTARAVRLDAAGPFIAHEMAAARPGDVLLENALARFFITGDGGGDGWVPFAGWIIDAGLQAQPGTTDYDGLDAFYPLVNLCPLGSDAVVIESDGSDGGPAVVSVSGKLAVVPDQLSVAGAEPEPVDVDVRVEYSLAPDEPALLVRTQVDNASPEAHAVEVDDVILFGDDEADAFSVPGGLDTAAPLTAPEVIGSSHETRPVSYAVYAPGRDLELLQGSTVGDQLGGDGSLVGYRIVSATLQPGESLEAERLLAVARDVAGALDPRAARLATPLARLGGDVRAAGSGVAGARVSVFEDAGLEHFVTQTLSDDTGHFELEAPAGTGYVIATARGTGEWVGAPSQPRELAEGYSPSSAEPVTLSPERAASVELLMGPPAHLRLEVRDGRGARIPAKLTFQAEDTRPGLCAACGERAPHPERGVRQLAWTADGAVELDLEAGAYTITASHGPNAELGVRRGVRLTAGETTSLAFTVPESVHHQGYVAIDPHVHGVFSQHGEATRVERVITALAEGLDVIVNTDHDVIADYAPAVRELGVERELLTIGGVELKTNGGDQCAWPLRPDPAEPLGGARRWWRDGRAIADTYRYYRERGALVISVAHGTGFFANAGYDRETASVQRPDRFSFDFDAMEVHNGGGGGGRATLLPTWVSLIDHGHRVAPLAASDSHSRRSEVGIARTYVRLGAGRRDAEGVARATAALRTVASTGPFIDLQTREGAGPGDTVHIAAGGELVLSFSVWAPSWMRLDQVHLLAGGVEIQRWDATSQPPVRLDAQRAVWLEAHVTLTPARDQWYAIEASGAAELEPVYAGSSPWALTAPLFVDTDGDGELTPSGAPGD
jgi:hypothetical protein